MATQEHQPSEETMRDKSFEVAHTIEEKSLKAVLTVEKDAKPFEQLLIKCKDDWIHHLAQALAFSFLSTLASIATLLSIFALLLRNLDTQAQHILTRGLESIFPSPLSSPVGEVFSKAYDTLSHASGIGVFFTLLVAILFGQMLFSL